MASAQLEGIPATRVFTGLVAEALAQAVEEPLTHATVRPTPVSVPLASSTMVSARLMASEREQPEALAASGGRALASCHLDGRFESQAG
jgi:hypothetical protein